ncbi:aldehyde dehydrogenase [Flavitalea flava]
MPENELLKMRDYYESGQTRPYSFRKQQLQLLKQAVLKYEKEIAAALYADLHKSPEEAYATETGIVLSEINVTIKKLHKWMKPQRPGVNLVNLPSSGKIYRDPLGVVLIISPWNYPLQLLLIPLAGAIAGGNCAVIKPSEFAPATAVIIERLIREIYPEQYIRVIQGDGAAVIPPLMNKFRFDHIFYTGSLTVGKAIYQMAAKDLIPVTLELGGKSPAVVENDADLASTVRRIAIGKFANAGQTCVAPDYVLVHTDIHQRFIEEMRSTLIKFFGSDTAQSESYGRIVNANRFDKLSGYLQEGKIVIGGQTSREGLFIAPTVMEEIITGAALMKEEIFGPILPVYPFTTRKEAMDLIKMNPNPLAFYVFTSNSQTEKEWIEGVAFGGGCVNNTVWQFANHYFPFGGIGNSGMGAYHGRHSFETFTHAKPILRTPTWFDPDLKYPPFKGKLKWFKMLIK